MYIISEELIMCSLHPSRIKKMINNVMMIMMIYRIYNINFTLKL